MFKGNTATKELVKNRYAKWPRGTLVHSLSETLRESVLSGQYKVGEKLPSEAALTNQYKVSRTVVREAIAALRSDGLVEARQGAGVFVINNQIPSTAPFQDVDPQKISSILEILELRAGVETEAAGLAAMRRSPSQEDEIYEKLEEFDACLKLGEPAADADIAFHLAIAKATNNPRFIQFLSLLGHDAIPRSKLEYEVEEVSDGTYLQQLQVEHRKVAEAISERDENRARQVMRDHLLGSQARYKRLLRSR